MKGQQYDIWSSVTRQQSTSPAVTSIDLSGNRCSTRRLWPLLTALVKYQSAEVN